MAQGNTNIDKITRALVGRIITQVYEPGHALNETTLAAEFGISRTPIRQVLQNLELLDWVEVIPRVGTRVKYIDYRFIKDAFELWRHDNELAIRLACQRSTPEHLRSIAGICDDIERLVENRDTRLFIPTYFTFYHAIHQASRNNLVLEQLNYLKEKFAQAWYYAGVEFDDYRCQCREIILAMAADEPEEAIRIAGLEQDNFQALLRKYLF